MQATSEPATITYHGIAIAKWNRIKAAASSRGLTISADAGKGSVMGVTCEWRWTPDELMISIVDPGLFGYDVAGQFLDTIIKNA